MLRWWKEKFGNTFGSGAVDLGPGVIRVKNTTTANLPAFSILGIDFPVIDFTITGLEHEIFRGMRLIGKTPSTDNPWFGILQEPALKNDGFAKAVIHGCAWAPLFINHAADVACDVVLGQTQYLGTGAVGHARIIKKSPGTGLGVGLVRLGDPVTMFFGKPNATIASLATDGVVDVWDGHFSGALGNQATACHNPSETDLETTDKVFGVLTHGKCTVGKIC